jgi:hypothetical protein
VNVVISALPTQKCLHQSDQTGCSYPSAVTQPVQKSTRLRHPSHSINLLMRTRAKDLKQLRATSKLLQGPQAWWSCTEPCHQCLPLHSSAAPQNSKKGFSQTIHTRCRKTLVTSGERRYNSRHALHSASKSSNCACLTDSQTRALCEA